MLVGRDHARDLLAARDVEEERTHRVSPEIETDRERPAAQNARLRRAGGAVLARTISSVGSRIVFGASR